MIRDGQGKTDIQAHGGPVVLCDDDGPFREALGEALGALGYAVRSADGAASLFALLDSLRPACLILDQNMPGRDGLAIQQDLRRDGFAFPVIFLTGCADENVRARAMASGAHAYLGKPVALDVLDAALAAALPVEARAKGPGSRGPAPRGGIPLP